MRLTAILTLFPQFKQFETFQIFFQKTSCFGEQQTCLTNITLPYAFYRKFAQ